jgi:hypothetical protein
MNVRLVHQVANQPHAEDRGSLPSPIRRRLIKLHDEADEAEARAATLQWMMEGSTSGGDSPYKVRVLLETAARLRMTASSLVAPGSTKEKSPTEAI